MPIQLFVPKFDIDGCLAEIRECLEKGWTGLGFKTVQFEDAWKEYTGMPYAHFLCSATAGLHLAIKVLMLENNWQEGDEIISTPLTFVSTNHAIAYENLKVVFADVDESLCLDPASIEARITPRTRAVMFVGYGGNVGRYKEVVEICHKHNLKLILDAAHMSGTRYNDGNIPGVGDADVTVYSFQAVKNLPTADSGMICFKEEAHDVICRKLTWLGINKDTYARTNSKGNYKWKYDVEYVGYKDHGNSIMAAIGIVQLKHLDRDNAYRRQLADWYMKGLGSNPAVTVIPVSPDCEPSRHLFVIKTANRDELLKKLNENDVFPGVHYTDNIVYSMYSYAEGTCPKAREYSNSIMSLPMHMNLTKADVDYVCGMVNKYAR